MNPGRRMFCSRFVSVEAIMKRKALKAIFGMMAFVLLGCLLGRPAYAYSYYYESPVSSWNFGRDYQYHSYNWAAYNDMGYYQKDNFSSMNIAATLYTDPSTISSVAVITYGDLFGKEYHEVGPVATWNSAMGYNDYVTSYVEYSIMLGRGEAGAMGYGWGYVGGPNGNQRIGSEYFTLGVIDDLGPIQPTSLSENGYSNGMPWNPGARNFVGSDGRLYGVGFVDSNGEVVVPDMIRVKLDDGQAAYVSIDEMDAASFDYASTQSDRLRASKAVETETLNAVKESVKEVLGVSVDDDNAEALIESFSQPSRRQMGEGLIQNFSDSYENEASDIDRKYSEVLSLVRDKTSFDIPAYAEDGTTVIGTYTVNRV